MDFLLFMCYSKGAYTEKSRYMSHIDFERPCHVHFIGIGGISMSGLAEILLERGFTVSGSDARAADLTKRL